jgi:hypothetical protein
MMRVTLAVFGLLALALLGCSPGSRRGEPPPAASPGSSAVGGPPASAQPLAPKPPSPRLSDPLWIRGSDEDPLERARLAEAIGASELILGLDDGGQVANTALAALPFADDADIALGKLGSMALTAGPAELLPILEAILAIAGKPARPREPLDPEGARACGAAMLTVASRTSLPREPRSLAVSVARALAEKGFVDRARIPTDLDPSP